MSKRLRTSISHDVSVVNLWRRQLGDLSTTAFARRLTASEDFVLRLKIYKKLQRHRGCVNTVSFNAGGDIVVSGSDDKRVILWDWEAGHVKLLFHSGHHNNIFQAKMMPFTSDRSIVTCAADGQVRHAEISDNGPQTTLLGKHQRAVHRLAIEPGSPNIFYSCGEDGVVQHFDLRTRAAIELFICRPVGRRADMPVVQLNAIAINPRNSNLFAVAGADEYTRLYDIRRYKWNGSLEFGRPAEYFCPPHIIGNKEVGITGLAFSDQSELLVSYIDEFIYLFTQDMGLGPTPGHFPRPMKSPTSSAGKASEDSAEPSSGESSPSRDANVKIAPQVYKGHRNCETVKGVSFFGPKSEYVVSGSDCGRIFIWRKKGGQLVRVMEADKGVVNCIQSHPHITVLASSGIENDIKMWTPNALERATLPTTIEQVPKRFDWLAIDDEDDDYSSGDTFDYDDYNDFTEEDTDNDDDSDSDDEYMENDDNLDEGDDNSTDDGSEDNDINDHNGDVNFFIDNPDGNDDDDDC